MALAALKTWVAAEVLTAADLNAERDNILNNALSLISPLTGNLAAGGNDFTGLDELAFNDAAANASATRRLRANAANLTWHDGTAAGRIFYVGGTDVPVADGGTGISSGTSGGIPYFSGTTTMASSAALTANGIVYGGGAGAAPVALGAMTNGQLVIGSTGAAPVVAALTAGANITITPGAGTLEIAGSAAVSAATQAEMEAASSTTVYASPGRTHFHPGVVKAWAKFTVAGVLTTSYNMTSITDTGAGNWTANIATDFSSGDPGYFATTNAGDNLTIATSSPAAGSVVIQTRDQQAAGALSDPGTGMYFIALGDQ